jgi:endonuclease YncB( thermonuclease family)
MRMDVTGTRATTHTIAIQRARSTLRRSLHTMMNIRRQPYGAISTAALRAITQGQQLVLVFDDVDKYGRIVVQAWVGNLDVNAEMVRRGAAWFESEWSNDNRLASIEDEARDRKVGLWAQPGRHVEPWVWRKEER